MPQVSTFYVADT